MRGTGHFSSRQSGAEIWEAGSSSPQCCCCALGKNFSAIFKAPQKKLQFFKTQRGESECWECFGEPSDRERASPRKAAFVLEALPSSFEQKTPSCVMY